MLRRVGEPLSSCILKGSQVGEGRTRLGPIAGGFRGSSPGCAVVSRRLSGPVGTV